MRTSKTGIVDEAAAIRILRSELARSTLRGVVLGIGDDAAILRPPQQPLVWTVDSSVEGVHFDLRWLTLKQAAARAFVAALSDLAAMGAEPLGALCALGTPRGTTALQFRAVARGQAEVAGRYGCPLIGGNLCQGDHFSFTTTVLGRSRRSPPRSGAKPGDEVWVVGELGEAAAGLELLRRASTGAGRSAKRSSAPSVIPTLGAAERRCVKRWRSPSALIEEGRELGRRANALIDVSDGLASEANHLAEASGVRIVLDHSLLEAACTAALCAAAHRLSLAPLQFLLSGGEDYALLATGPTRRRPRAARVLGEVTRGSGVWVRKDDELEALPTSLGFDHYRSR